MFLSYTQSVKIGHTYWGKREPTWRNQWENQHNCFASCSTFKCQVLLKWHKWPSDCLSIFFHVSVSASVCLHVKHVVNSNDYKWPWDSLAAFYWLLGDKFYFSLRMVLALGMYFLCVFWKLDNSNGLLIKKNIAWGKKNSTSFCCYSGCFKAQHYFELNTSDHASTPEFSS